MDRALDAAAPADVKTQWNVRDKTSGRERVVCLDEPTGRVLWTFDYPSTYAIAYGSGPRATPTVHGDAVYALGTMGDLLCLDAATGRVAWRVDLVRDLGAEVPLYGFACPPLVDGDRLVVMVGGAGRAVVAFDRRTGKVLWKALDASEPGYCAPVLRTLGGRRQLVVWHADALAGLDPATGTPLWTLPHPVKAGLCIATPAAEGDRLAVSSQYEGAMVLAFSPDAAEPKVLWKASTGAAPEKTWKPAGLNTTLSTVLLQGRHVYGTSLYGEFCCLDGETGKRVWTTLEPTSGGTVPKDRWSSTFLVTHRDRVFIFNEKGDLILARLTPTGYEETGRAHVIDPDMPASAGGRKVVWSHPAFANRRIYARNDHEIVCASLAATD
jgi:outer membrane protein assembly factor BamB